MKKILAVLTLIAVGIAAYLFAHVGIWVYLSPAYAASGHSLGRAFAAFQFALLAAYLPFMVLIPLFIVTRGRTFETSKAAPVKMPSAS
ncbi:MAG: hypothetical protein WC767_02490 [Candidatus Paceibacterota bacterium]|jgi:hypothetical protein